MSARFS